MGTPSLSIGHPDQCSLELRKQNANQPKLRCSMLSLLLRRLLREGKKNTKVGVANVRPVYQTQGSSGRTGHGERAPDIIKARFVVFLSSDHTDACFSCVSSELVHMLTKMSSECPTFFSCPTSLSELANAGERMKACRR